MLKSFFGSAKWALWAYCGLFLLLFFLYIQTSLNVAINEWYKDFYDVLQKPKIQSKAEQKAERAEKRAQRANAHSQQAQNADDLAQAKTTPQAEISGAFLDEAEFARLAKALNVEFLSEKKPSQMDLNEKKDENSNETNFTQTSANLDFIAIYSAVKERNASLEKLAKNQGVNSALLDEFIRASEIKAAAQTAQAKLDEANFLNKFSLFYYQNLLEHFFGKRSISGENAYSIEVFYTLIWVFLCIALPYVLIATINVYFASIYALKWREAMTFEYLAFWKAKDDNIEGSSQRIQEDIYNFSKIVESLGLAFIRALMILFAFIPILWALSGVIAAPLFEGIDENSIFAPLKHIDGLLVYVALFISLGGLFISWFVGIKLPGLEYNNQKAEAAFRKELVFAEDNRRDYAARETMIELFTGLKFNYKRLFLHYGYFNIWLILFEQVIVIVPLLIVAPSLFAGAIGLGVVMQMNNAFDQVRSSFSVFITNWTKITELRSIHKRLKEFEENIGYRKNREKV